MERGQVNGVYSGVLVNCHRNPRGTTRSKYEGASERKFRRAQGSDCEAIVRQRVEMKFPRPTCHEADRIDGANLVRDVPWFHTKARRSGMRFGFEFDFA